jgi:predicted O-methyltransferase YrrM
MKTMKYQFVAENSAEEEALKANFAVKPLFEPFLPVLQARAIMAGVRLGIFAALGHDSYTAGQLAEKTSLDAECLNLLLRVLTNSGYVARQDEMFQLAEVAKSALLPDSPMRLTGWVEYNYIQWEIISKLEEVVKTGKGLDFRKCLKNPADWAANQRAMLETARPAAAGVASQIPIRDGALKMLDIGGSHGLYGAMICRNNPPMRCEVLELPEAVKPARQLAHEEGIDDIVEHCAVDVLKDKLGEDYDAAFLGNITHHFTSGQNLDLFKRIRTALRQDGTIAIWEFISPEKNGTPNLVGDGLALFFRITSEAQCYKSSDYIDWLKAAGFEDIISHPTPSPSQMLVSGRARG